MNLPSFESYGNSASKNYGLNCLRFFGPDGSIFWYSYKTLVAFKKPGGPTFVHENDWGPTTGKHLNLIDGGHKQAKEKRLSAEDFAHAYADHFGEESEAA